MAPEAMLSATTARQVPRTAPRTLFISKVFIAASLRRKWRWISMLRRCTNSRFATPLATRISTQRDVAHGTFFAMSEDVLIVIPARMASTRLPGKPLADIGGEPMIVHVLRRAQAAGVGTAVVATDAEAIAAAVTRSGGRA